MEGGKALSPPLPPSMKLCLNDCQKFDAKKAEMAKMPYLSAVGCLMYAMICTHLDIAFAVGVISCYMSNLGKKHWEAIKELMRYLNGTKDVGVCFGGEDACVLGYKNSNYGGDMDKRKSTLGYVFLYMGGDVSWRSHLQNCTTMPITKARYVAASETSKAVIWLACLVLNLGISADTPTLGIVIAKVLLCWPRSQCFVQR
ncbi:hypothetical protein L7F22_027313 [Adiantum nelumboides]|nr:hypothetical protein [Adiantum nelumboides]